MAVIHLAGAVASFLIAGYLLIVSIFGTAGFGTPGLLFCLTLPASTIQCHSPLMEADLLKFAIGIGLLVFGTWIAYRSRN